MCRIHVTYGLVFLVQSPLFWSELLDRFLEEHWVGCHGPEAYRGPLRPFTYGLKWNDRGGPLKFETDFIIEGIRLGRVVRVRPNAWPKTQMPREEYLFQNTPENRLLNLIFFQSINRTICFPL